MNKAVFAMQGTFIPLNICFPLNTFPLLSPWYSWFNPRLSILSCSSSMSLYYITCIHRFWIECAWLLLVTIHAFRKGALRTLYSLCTTWPRIAVAMHRFHMNTQWIRKSSHAGKAGEWGWEGGGCGTLCYFSVHAQLIQIIPVPLP